MEETNKVCCLKLLWRLLSADSLWVRWVEHYLIRKGSLWQTNEKSSLGTWIWKKILKYRNLASALTQVEIQSGTKTSFWFDSWSPLGRIIDITGTRGCIDLGLPINATVEFAIQRYRSRRHRVEILLTIEQEILKVRSKGLSVGTDIRLWKEMGDSFKPTFSTQQTWQMTRTQSPKVSWYRVLWFPGATPRYSVLTWIAIHDRLATCVRVKKWSPQTDAHCILCSGHLETREHLFFSCAYTQKIWKGLTMKLLGPRYTESWNCILNLLAETGRNSTHMFLLRYAFQCSIHSIWRERNGRKHGEMHQSSEALLKFIDKGVRNRISSLRMGGRRSFSRALMVWFDTRS